MQDMTNVVARLPMTPTVEFICQREFIAEQIQAGQRKTDIWRALRDEQKISMGYSHFRKLCKKHFGTALKQKKNKEGQQLPGKAGGPVIARPPAKKEFKWDLNIDDYLKSEFR